MALTPEERKAAQAALAKKLADKEKQGSVSKNTSEDAVPLLIEPYGYGTDKTHHSKYDKAQWEKWASETGFKPKGKTAKEQNLEFQTHLLTHPDFKDKVKAIHEELGMPYAGKPEDSFLGERWDKIMEKLTAPEVKKPEAVVKEPDAITPPVATNPPTAYRENQNAPWWLQDIIKTAGAVGDKARIKKYLPWQATAPVSLPDTTFYDPTRELAANAEQANIANQAAAAFTDPRQLAAQQAATQGLAGKNAADIMGRYNNMNVTLANQASQQNASTMNAANQNKANLDTQLWDKYTVANQQFDNSKNQARQQIRQSYIDAITNRANTANLNSMFPQYAVDPSSGGFTYFKNPKDLNPTKNLNDIEDQYTKALKLTGDPDRALKLMQLQSTGKLPVDNSNYPNGYPG